LSNPVFMISSRVDALDNVEANRTKEINRA